MAPEVRDENTLALREREQEEVDRRSSIRAQVVHETIRREGEDELRRPSQALAWSGLAAGLSMGFSLVGEGLLRAHLPAAPWRPVVAKLGYSIGFLVVVLGRQQLFTENTLTPVLPLLRRSRPGGILNLAKSVDDGPRGEPDGGGHLRLGGREHRGGPAVQQAFLETGREAAAVSFGNAVLRGVFAGWLIALMVWLMPFADTARWTVIVILTWLVGLGA